LLYAFERVEGPIGAKRDDYNAALIALNAVAPHVEKGTELTLDQFLIKYGEQSDEDRAEGELGEPEVWLDQSFFGNFSGDQVPTSSELG
jgi:hypothetical protein